MKRKLLVFALAGITGLMGTACGAEDEKPKEMPLTAYADMEVGKTNTDIQAELKVLTNRTDLIDTDFADYVEAFTEMYPNIKIQYEGITDYEGDVTTRLTTGDWGDICCIPATVDKNELGTYFEKFGTYDQLQQEYAFVDKQVYQGDVYGIPLSGQVSGVVYNKKVFEQAGITELPVTPEEFLVDLQKIADNTDAIPLYTNYAAGWTLNAWDAYISGGATGDGTYKNHGMVHEKDPFSKREDMTGPYAVYYTLYEAVARGLTEEDPTTTDWDGCKTQINDGKIGCMVLGCWAVPQMQQAGENAEDIAYMPFPITVDGAQYASAGADYCYGINVNSSAEEKTAAMLYIKWLTESSGYAYAQGSIPVVKGEAYPESLKSFETITLVVDQPAPEGEEELFGKVNRDSEISLDSDSVHVARIVEAAMGGTETLDEITADWNAAWSSAQESNGVITE